jgi:hypothetical protein
VFKIAAGCLIQRLPLGKMYRFRVTVPSGSDVYATTRRGAFAAVRATLSGKPCHEAQHHATEGDFFGTKWWRGKV